MRPESGRERLAARGAMQCAGPRARPELLHHTTARRISVALAVAKLEKFATEIVGDRRNLGVHTSAARPCRPPAQSECMQKSAEYGRVVRRRRGRSSEGPVS